MTKNDKGHRARPAKPTRLPPPPPRAGETAYQYVRRTGIRPLGKYVIVEDENGVKYKALVEDVIR